MIRFGIKPDTSWLLSAYGLCGIVAGPRSVTLGQAFLPSYMCLLGSSFHLKQLLHPEENADSNSRTDSNPEQQTISDRAASQLKDDPINQVSRHHCEVYVVVYDEHTSHVYVRDCESSNGTFVNGVSIGSKSALLPGYLLEHGDVIEIKPHWKFTLYDNAPATSTMTAIQQAECKLIEAKYLVGPRRIGYGADGVVFLATETETNKQLVCKVADLQRFKGRNTQEGLRRTLQESDVLRQLQHPNILPYIDAVLSPHSLYTFTELATGGDLLAFLHPRASIDETETRVIVRQVLQALAYIHSKGVFHRDLKPENILMERSPYAAYNRVMLSDFGACAVPRRSRLLTRTGTVNYQAPEIQGQGQLQTPAVDIWSLGIVVLFMLTHHMDVQLVGLDGMEQQRLDEFLSQHIFRGGGFSVNCENFVKCCLRVSPLDRTSAARALCHDWLCTPDTHRNFFQRMERKSRSGWTPPRHLRPMPLQLGDVTTEHCSRAGSWQSLVPAIQPALGSESPLSDYRSEYFDDAVGLEARKVGGSTGESILTGSVTETKLIERRHSALAESEKRHAEQAGQVATPASSFASVPRHLNANGQESALPPSLN